MNWFQWFSILSLIICVASVSWHFIRLIRLGRPIDYSPSTGNETQALLYSFTGAMSPLKKESAFLHLPTYTAGLIYHLGTFLAILLFFMELAGFIAQGALFTTLSLLLFISAGCGVGILVKRIMKPGLRSLSSPDDYVSNILVTLFQCVTAIMLLVPSTRALYHISTGLLLLYFPLGKLRHAVYFFAARYQLGVFFGHRNVWPPKNL